MQVGAGLELLTTGEAAGYLRLKERKLYELVADRQIPCTKVTGKWLFSRADLDRWLLAGMARPHGVIPAEPPPIVGGSHDPLLQWALSESHAGLAILPEGSEAGYQRFLKGEVIAAAIHFHDLDDPEKDANLEIVRREATLYDAVLVGFAAREQGLLVAPGNPLGLARLRDAHERKLRIAVRPDGAGAQQLLMGLLKRDGLSIGDFGRTFVAPTGPDIAQAIRSGHADCGHRHPGRGHRGRRRLCSALHRALRSADAAARLFPRSVADLPQAAGRSALCWPGGRAWRARCVGGGVGTLVAVMPPCNDRHSSPSLTAAVRKYP